MTTKGPKVTYESPSASTASARESRPTPASALLPGTLAGVLALGALLLLALVAPRAQAADPFPGEGFLPNGMAWEKVSPADKNGYDIQPERGQAAGDGEAVLYLSYGTFLDSPSGVGRGNYLGERGAAAWQNKAVMPDHAPGLAATPTTEFASEDVSKTIVSSSNALTPDATFGVDSLYLRDNATDAWTLLNPSPIPSADPSDVRFVAATPDASHVVFEDSRQLHPDAAAGETNVYVWHDGTVDLVGYLPDGTVPPGGSGSPAGEMAASIQAISADGSKIVFKAGDDLYARVDGSSTVELSASEATTPGTDGDNNLLAMTAEGSKVFFLSDESLTDDATAEQYGIAEIYEYDFGKPAGSRLRDLMVMQATPASSMLRSFWGFAGIDADGTHAYFLAERNLETGAGAGSDRFIYRWSDGPGNGSLTLVTKATSATKGFLIPTGGSGDTTDISSDGRVLAFLSAEQLTDAPVVTTAGTGVVHQMYVYDAATGGLSCASCRPDGELTTQNTSIQRGGLTTFDFISTDGARVFFSTKERLAPQDTNSAEDVYMWEDGVAHLISNGRGVTGSELVDISDTGDSAFFTTREQLVGTDIDTLQDIYVARVGGGLESQRAPLPPVECEGDGCQDDPTAPAAGDEIGSGEFTGPGNSGSGAKRCSALKRRADRIADRTERAHQKARRAKRKASRASDKRAKRLRRKAQRLRRKTKQLRQKKRAGERRARACRRAAR